MAEGRTPGGPPSPDRRKLLLVLGYGAASVLALRELGSTCTDGQTQGVPYTAEYRFYVKA